jgi:hypothetical protein
MSSRGDRLAKLGMARPREFLFGMKQPGEIHGGIGIAEELRSCHSQRINGGECWRHSGGWVRAYRAGKLRDSLHIDVKIDRRIGSPGDGCSMAGLCRHAN